MSYKKRYLDLVASLRKRADRVPLARKRLLVALVMFVLLTVVVTTEVAPFGYRVEVEKPSPRTIVAPSTVQYIDRSRTQEQQDAAAAALSEVYVTDEEVAGNVIAGIDRVFAVADEVSLLAGDEAERSALGEEKLEDKAYATVLGQLLALAPAQRAAARQVVTSAVAAEMEHGVHGGEVEAAVKSASARISGQTDDPGIRQAAQSVAAAAMKPNLIEDQAETEGRRQSAREAVKPVVTTRLEGEVIVRKGAVVTPEVYDLLKSLGFTGWNFSLLRMLYVSVLVALLIAAMAMYLAKFRRIYYDSPGLLLLLGSSIVTFAVFANLLTFASKSWSSFWGYLMPSAAIAIIVAVLFDSGTALVSVAMCGLIAGVVTKGDFSLMLLIVLGGIFPSMYASRTSTRHELRRVGLYTSFWTAGVAFGATLLTQGGTELLLNTGIGFLNGAVCAIAAMGSLPFLETTFRVTTNTWLLELAAPDQELMKQLTLKAPGTYSHSVMVANLAEAAAREIGSDPMLARVAAYYHDIGKITKPQYFVENQQPGENPHEGLSPNLSLLIITSHVRDGVEMLEKHHFPPDLVEIIREHHGTSVVRYFYEAALEGEKRVDIERFRYHYTRPRRRTAGILMLADAVEATARTLENPSAVSIQQMVEKIVDDKLEDGQLDECPLTFEELNKIKAIFERMLIGSYHPRVDYPDSRAERKNGRKGEDRPADGGDKAVAGAT